MVQVIQVIIAVCLFLLGVGGLGVDLHYSYNPGIGCSTDLSLGVGAVSALIAAYSVYLGYRAWTEAEWSFGAFELVYTVLLAVMNGFLSYWHVQTSESKCNPVLFRFGWIHVVVWVEVGLTVMAILCVTFVWPSLKKLKDSKV